jgi:hypothetical protein
VNADPSHWEEEIRRLGRDIAAELGDSERRSASGVDVGWPLWEGVTLTGEERMKDGTLPTSVYWTYTTTIALRTDGELVSFQTTDGRTSPNLTFSPSIRVASDDVLSYPDAISWEEVPSVEEASIRTIIDTFRVPAEHTQPGGHVYGRCSRM